MSKPFFVDRAPLAVCTERSGGSSEQFRGQKTTTAERLAYRCCNQYSYACGREGSTEQRLAKRIENGVACAVLKPGTLLASRLVSDYNGTVHCWILSGLAISYGIFLDMQPQTNKYSWMGLGLHA
jgi:hypothetical protein